MNPLEAYLRELRDLRRSGSAVPEHREQFMRAGVLAWAVKPLDFDRRSRDPRKCFP